MAAGLAVEMTGNSVWDCEKAGGRIKEKESL
jgi:hypothetical protein